MVAFWMDLGLPSPDRVISRSNLKFIINKLVQLGSLGLGPKDMAVLASMSKGTRKRDQGSVSRGRSAPATINVEFIGLSNGSLNIRHVGSWISKVLYCYL